MWCCWKIKLNKNADPDKRSNSGYDIGFDVRGHFSLLGSSGIGKNLIIFRPDNSSSVNADNWKKIH